MNRGLVLLLLLLLSIWGCENPSSNTVVKPETLNPDNLTAVEFNLTSYNKIEVKSDSNFYLNSKRITKILVGEYSNGNVIASDSLIPDYILIGNDIVLSFDRSIIVADSVIYFDAGVKFIMKDTSDVIFHKDFSMLTYQYKTARLVIKTDEFSSHLLLDFCYNYPIIYYRQAWVEDGYKYNIQTKQKQKIIDPTGAYLDANSSYLFSDENFNSIVRYSTAKDSLDLIANQNFSFNTYGIGIMDTVVYIVTAYPYGLMLRSYTFDLQPINSIPLYAGDLSSLTSYNGKLLTVFRMNKLASFDPETGHFSGNPTASLPTLYTNAIKVQGDSLYFTDSAKRCIGVVPVKDVFPNF
jgi:hypothetical protein